MASSQQQDGAGAEESAVPTLRVMRLQSPELYQVCHTKLLHWKRTSLKYRICKCTVQAKTEIRALFKNPSKLFLGSLTMDDFSFPLSRSSYLI